MGPRVAIVHDYLTQRGGAERVVAAMHRAFPDAPIHTSLFDPGGTFPELRDLDVRTTWLDGIGSFRTHHRRAFPLLPLAFQTTHIDADVVLCSSSGWAHGISSTGAKVVYCHNPARWLYQTAQYGDVGRGSRLAAAVARPALVRWDRRAAGSATRYLVNSRAVQQRVRSAYGIEADVLHPPFALHPIGPEQPLLGVGSRFWLAVGRMLPYKRMGTVAAAFRHLPGERLVVVGDGPARSQVRAAAGEADVLFVGEVDDAELRWLYRNATGLVSASLEDFGLTPLEAAAHGTPSVLLRWGGFLDTLVEGRTGLFFDEPTPAAVARAVREASARRWDEQAIRAHGEAFGEQAFIDRLRALVDEVADRQVVRA